MDIFSQTLFDEDALNLSDKILAIPLENQYTVVPLNEACEVGFRLGLQRAAELGKQAESFQARVKAWLLECFGEEISNDRQERNHRFLEESLELVQSCGCTASEAHQLVDYVFSRDIGEKSQECGGVMVTLAALCLANGISMEACGEKELARIWMKVSAIRAKQSAKPKHSPLPIKQAESGPLVLALDSEVPSEPGWYFVAENGEKCPIKITARDVRGGYLSKIAKWSRRLEIGP